MKINYKTRDIASYGADWPVGAKLRVVKFTDGTDKKNLAGENLGIDSIVTLDKTVRHGKYRELIVHLAKGGPGFSATTFELYEDKI